MYDRLKQTSSSLLCRTLHLRIRLISFSLSASFLRIPFNRHLIMANQGEKKREALVQKVQRRVAQIQRLEDSVFQLANYYFIFQGVVLSAVWTSSGDSSTSSIKCNHVWLPLTLSSIAAVLNFVSLFKISFKYMRTLDMLDEDNKDLCKKLYPQSNDPLHMQMANRQWWEKFLRRVMLAGSMILFLAFASVNLAGTWLITCRG